MITILRVIGGLIAIRYGYPVAYLPAIKWPVVVDHRLRVMYHRLSVARSKGYGSADSELYVCR